MSITTGSNMDAWKNGSITFTGDAANAMFGHIVRDDENYVVTDYRLEGVTVSVTELHEGKATRGHSHHDAELYVFQTDAVVRLGHRTYETKKGQMLLVRPGQFHRVYAPPGRTARFVCVFAGTRDAKKADYKS